VIRRAAVLFCDNEHGTGDVLFTGFSELPDLEEAAMYTAPISVVELRRRARKAGWSRSGNVDFCPICTECEKERL
jgi:hypothetical protein